MLRLLAANNDWAGYVSDGSSEMLEDPFQALKSLVSMKSARDLVSFLRSKEAASSDMAWRFGDLGLEYPFEQSDRAFPLRGDFGFECSKAGVSALTKEVVDENALFMVSIKELLCFKAAIERLLSCAAVALGDNTPKWMLDYSKSGERPSKYPLNETDLVISFILPYRSLGVTPGGFFDSARLNTLEEFGTCSLFAGVMISSQVFDRETEAPSLIVLSSEGEQPSQHQAEAACGLAVVNALNSCCRADSLRVNDYSTNDVEDPVIHVPDHVYEYSRGFTFAPGTGFAYVEPPRPVVPWYELLLNQAVDAIVDGRVNLCPHCGRPVVYRDKRGRPGKRFCSDSCKTMHSKAKRNDS